MKLVTEFLSFIGKLDDSVYRGQASVNWPLLPSISRLPAEDDVFLRREAQALQSFKLRAIPFLKYHPVSDLDWLTLMQHHGLPTRLLDFSTNPLAALFFACDLSSGDDGAVHCIESSEFASRGEIKIGRTIEQHSDFLHFPSHITERVVGQSGCFLCCAKPTDGARFYPSVRFVIPADKKRGVLISLRMLGISHGTLFPGLDGICRDLKDLLVEGVEIDTQVNELFRSLIENSRAVSTDESGA